MIAGDEIFKVQRALYKHLGGVFGMSEKNRNVIVVALDAAAIFGALSAKHGEAGFQGSEDRLLELLTEKMKRLGAL